MILFLDMVLHIELLGILSSDCRLFTAREHEPFKPASGGPEQAPIGSLDVELCGSKPGG